MVERFKIFLRGVKQEMKFVTWPTKDDLKEGTIVVIIMSIMVALFLALVDFAGYHLIKLLLFKG